MVEPEKPELEAVAWEIMVPQHSGTYRRTVTTDANRAQRHECAGHHVSTLVLGAEADRVRALRDKRIAELEAGLARWRSIARAAVKWRELDSKIGGSDEDELADNAELAADALEPIADSVDALSEQERSEILEEDT